MRGDLIAKLKLSLAEMKALSDGSEFHKLGIEHLSMQIEMCGLLDQLEAALPSEQWDLFAQIEVLRARSAELTARICDLGEQNRRARE